MSGLATYLRRIAATALVVVGISVLAAAPAEAAYFTYTPQTYNADGAGPFYYSFKATQTGMAVAYKLSTESSWHRCVDGTGQVSLSNLPDGQYSITIADDTPSNPSTQGGGRECGGESPYPKLAHTFYVGMSPPSPAPPPPPVYTPPPSRRDPAPALTASNARYYAASVLRKKFGRSYKKGRNRKFACTLAYTALHRSCKVSWRYRTGRYEGRVSVWHTDNDWRETVYYSFRLVRKLGNHCKRPSQSCWRVYEE